MQSTTTSIAGTAILWLGTLAGAFYLGASREPNNHGHAAAGSAMAGKAAGETPANRSGQEGRSSHGREVAAQAPTVKQILAKMKATMRGGAMQNPSTMMKVMGLLDKIRPEDVQEALAEAEAMTDPQQKMLLSMCLLGKWAELDGPAAMKYAEEHATGSGPLGQMAKMSVAGAWAEKDPEAVWLWYQNRADKDGGGVLGSSMVLTSLFASLADNDPDLAFKRLQEIDAPARQMALAGMLQSAIFDDARREAILAKVAALPDEAERKQAKQMMLSQWAMVAPEQAVAWMRTQPQSEQADLRESMGMMLMMSDPKQGANLMLEGATDENRARSYARIVSQWANMDTNAAGTWLKEQPQGPHLDEARHSFVNAASEKDPQTAMEWAATITNPDLRVGATATAYQAWLNRDAEAAEQALGRSGLDAAQIQAVKAGQPTPDGAD
jgi:hypothetical protein